MEVKEKPHEITQKIRFFNRFYTRIIGAVNQSVLNSPFSMAEVRVLFEIKHSDNPTASEVNRELELDPGYLSRIVRRFEQDELLTKERSHLDGRAYLLKLTEHGERVLASLEKASDKKAADLISPLSEREITALLRSMETIHSLLTKTPLELEVRPAAPGELGTIVARHMDYYSKQYAFDASFESYLFEGIARFLKNRENGMGQAWVVKHGGVVVGSIAIDHVEDRVAQLRWFLVEPEYRGMGMGRRLIEEALDFSRMNLYHRIFLWTFSELRNARHLYEMYGFSPTEEVTHTIWGRELTEERWDILLFDPDEEVEMV